eukprot:1159175-Pelagomonas_calceolata.AAC.24
MVIAESCHDGYLGEQLDDSVKRQSLGRDLTGKGQLATSVRTVCLHNVCVSIRAEQAEEKHLA